MQDRWPDRRLVAWFLLLLCSPVAALLVLACGYYGVANGIGAGALVLASLPLLLLLLPRALGFPNRRLLGLLSPEERAVIEPATRGVYEGLAQRRGGKPSINTLLLSSSAERVEELVWPPPGEGPVPALIFLHGFGGLLTPYVETLAKGELGQSYAIVAPALDMSGYWWEPACGWWGCPTGLWGPATWGPTRSWAPNSGG